MTLQVNEPVATTEIGRLDPAAAFEAGLVELIPYLRARACALTGTRELALDLVQETLAKALRGRGSFEAGSDLKAWLSTILRNEYFSRQRRAWRQVGCSPEFAESIPAASVPQYWAAVLSDTTRALHCLPTVQREALILVGAGGFSYNNAAEISSIAVGTMKSRVARARQTLKRILDRDAPPLTKCRPATGNAMNEILVQLNDLSGIDAAASRLVAVHGATGNVELLRRKVKRASAHRKDQKGHLNVGYPT